MINVNKMSCLALVMSCSLTALYAQNSGVLTWHNDLSRTGQNLEETVLTPSNVTSEQFGLLGLVTLDGKVDAQPLYVRGLQIGGQSHNVVFVATENATVYALDAQTRAILWQKSLLASGETASDDRNCGQITPTIGATATPVIDLALGTHGAIYVVNMSHDTNGNYHHRLNALDLTTGAQLFGGPTEITATYPGTGPNSSGGKVVFDPGSYAERAALLEWNGNIYTTWTSHCDRNPYNGWVINYNASTLQQTSVLNLTPNGSEGAIWMSGAGPAATRTQIFFLDANGTFDTNLNANGFPQSGDYGNAFLKVNMEGGALKVGDYYAIDNTVKESNSDTDLGSGGVVLLPSYIDSNGIDHQLAVGAGKDGNIYVVNRANMGKFHPEGGYIYQVLTGALPNGEWSAPAYFNNTVFYGGVSDNLKAFSISNAKLVSTPSSRSANTFGYPGTTPSVSAHGSSNGIVWAVENSSSRAVLFAFNASDLSEELYDSNQSGTRDRFGAGNKFITPTIADGQVYVGTPTGIAVFGLLSK